MSKNSRAATAVADRTTEDAVAESASELDDAVEAASSTDEDVTEQDGEPSTNDHDTKAGAGTGDSDGRRHVLLVAAGLVAVVAIAVAVVFGWKLAQANAIDDAAAEALDAARSYAVVLTSVSSDDLDSNFAAVLDGATGEFKDMYAQSSEQLRQLLVDNNATAEGVVIDAGIKSATTTEVEVLLFVDQTVTNTVSPEPRLDRSRVVMTMELVDGRWLASDVTLP